MSRTPKGDRDEYGMFLKGHNLPGPGNPHGGTVARFRSALLKAATEKDFTKLGKHLLEQAFDGDVAAARLFLSYTLGPPDVSVNVQHSEGPKLTFEAVITRELLKRAEERRKKESNGTSHVIDVEASDAEEEEEDDA